MVKKKQTINLKKKKPSKKLSKKNKKRIGGANEPNELDKQLQLTKEETPAGQIKEGIKNILDDEEDKKDEKKEKRREQSCDSDHMKSPRNNTNCCTEANTSEACNSPSGTKKYIFDKIFPDIQFVLTMFTEILKKSKIYAEYMIEEVVPDAFDADPIIAAEMYKGKIKAARRMAEAKAAMRFGGKKSRKQQKSLKRTTKKNKRK